MSVQGGSRLILIQGMVFVLVGLVWGLVVKLTHIGAAPGLIVAWSLLIVGFVKPARGAGLGGG